MLIKNINKVKKKIYKKFNSKRKINIKFNNKRVRLKEKNSHTLGYKFKFFYFN